MEAAARKVLKGRLDSIANRLTNYSEYQLDAWLSLDSIVPWDGRKEDWAQFKHTLLVRPPGAACHVYEPDAEFFCQLPSRSEDVARVLTEISLPELHRRKLEKLKRAFQLLERKTTKRKYGQPSSRGLVRPIAGSQQNVFTNGRGFYQFKGYAIQQLIHDECISGEVRKLQDELRSVGELSTELPRTIVTRAALAKKCSHQTVTRRIDDGTLPKPRCAPGKKTGGYWYADELVGRIDWLD